MHMLIRSTIHDNNIKYKTHQTSSIQLNQIFVVSFISIYLVITFGVMLRFIFSTDQSVKSLLFKPKYISRTDLSIYLTVYHMIGRGMISQRLSDMTPSRMLLDFRVDRQRKNVKQTTTTTKLILIKLQTRQNLFEYTQHRVCSSLKGNCIASSTKYQRSQKLILHSYNQKLKLIID